MGDSKEEKKSRRGERLGISRRLRLPEIPTAQFRFFLPEFKNPIPVNPFPPSLVPPRPPGIRLGTCMEESEKPVAPTFSEAMNQIAEYMEVVQQMKRVATKGERKRMKTSVKEAPVPPSLMMSQLGEALHAMPTVLLQHASRLAGCVEGIRGEILTPGFYPPRRAQLETEYKDPTGVIGLKGSHSIVLREPGVYELFYRDIALLLDPNNFGVPEFYPGNFSLVAMALFATAPKCSGGTDHTTVMVPHSLSIIVPSNVITATTPLEVTNIRVIPGSFATFFDFISRPFALTHFRACAPCTRISLVAIAFSNRGGQFPTGQPPPQPPFIPILPPIFVDFDGVVGASWRHH